MPQCLAHCLTNLLGANSLIDCALPNKFVRRRPICNECLTYHAASRTLVFVVEVDHTTTNQSEEYDDD